VVKSDAGVVALFRGTIQKWPLSSNAKKPGEKVHIFLYTGDGMYYRSGIGSGKFG